MLQAFGDIFVLVVYSVGINWRMARGLLRVSCRQRCQRMENDDKRT